MPFNRSDTSLTSKKVQILLHFPHEISNGICSFSVIEVLEGENGQNNYKSISEVAEYSGLPLTEVRKIAAGN